MARWRLAWAHQARRLQCRKDARRSVSLTTPATACAAASVFGRWKAPFMAPVPWLRARRRPGRDCASGFHDGLCPSRSRGR